MKIPEKNWFEIVRQEFYHPATVLWRAVELRHIENAFFRHNLLEPVLDLGCAEGKIADSLFKKNILIGLDNCWELISQNKKEAYKALVLADGCKIPFKDKTFGSIFSNCVIEHILDLDSLLAESYRLLKPGGIFFFTVPSDKFGDFLFFSTIFSNLGLKGPANWYKVKRNELLNHFHCYDHSHWGELLKNKGFALIEYDYYMPKKSTFVWDFLAAIWFLPGKLKLNLSKKLFPLTELKALYNSDNIKGFRGGGLLIIAQKVG